MVPPARKKLGTRSPGKVVPDSLLIIQGNMMGCQVHFVKVQ